MGCLADGEAADLLAPPVRYGRAVTEQSAPRRWAVAVAQNLVANAVWVGGAAAWAVVAVWLARDGGNSLTVRVWWLVVAWTIAVAFALWLTTLTLTVLRLQRRSATTLGTGTRAFAPAHPHQALLDRIDGLDDSLRLAPQPNALPWVLGDLYNAILTEARQVSPRVNLAGIRVADQGAGEPETTAQDSTVLLAGLRQLRAIVGAST
jgi:hypothetical protein